MERFSFTVELVAKVCPENFKTYIFFDDGRALRPSIYISTKKVTGKHCPSTPSKVGKVAENHEFCFTFLKKGVHFFLFETLNNQLSPRFSAT
jgi:hypothetical protein